MTTPEGVEEIADQLLENGELERYFEQMSFRMELTAARSVSRDYLVRVIRALKVSPSVQ